MGVDREEEEEEWWGVVGRGLIELRALSCQPRGVGFAMTVVGKLAWAGAGGRSPDAHPRDDGTVARVGHPDCAGLGEERESAGARSRSFAMLRMTTPWGYSWGSPLGLFRGVGDDAEDVGGDVWAEGDVVPLVVPVVAGAG